MRRTVGVLALLAVLNGCVESTAETTTTASSTTTITTVAPTTTIPEVVTTTMAAATTTTTESTEDRVFTVELIGLFPEEPFAEGTASGSGCSPGTDRLPDGVWFGWVEDAGDDFVDFDLACFHDGRLEPAVQNESGRIRTLPLDPSARVFTGGAVSIAYAEWAPSGDPLWLFVNDREVTEIAVYDSPVDWAYSTEAWPAGMFPGCCDGGTVAPPSPADPWPEEGWPADGFYDVWIAGQGDDFLDVEIVRWYDCDDRPDLCAEWWVGDEVSSDPLEERLLRRIEFDGDLTVVIAPIPQGHDAVLVSDGESFGRMLNDLGQALDLFAPELDEGSDDRDHPFGPALYNGEIQDLGYRGPGGSVLTIAEGGRWWWYVLEIDDGQPTLYIHAGIIAG